MLSGAERIIRIKPVHKACQLFNYYFLLEKPVGCTTSDLNFETNVRATLTQLKNHKWTIRDIFHYSFLLTVITFVFIIFPAPILPKIIVFTFFVSLFLVPLTSQFFVHGLPVLAWLAFFFTCGKIPVSWKPAISVKFLPAMETVLYGDNLSNVLATITNSALDILAWLPYGILHFVTPFIVAALVFLFGPPTSLRAFGFAFGYMNLLGVMGQLSFPAAPPWYKRLHGLEPANYSMMGSPGGLGRIDKILGFDMYTTAFSNSPVVFGAFPSLHSGCAVMDVLFLSWLFPKYKYVWWFFAIWLWWSTMYLTHHYFIDLIGGAVLSYVVFVYTKYNHLPLMDAEKFCRWSYTEVKKICAKDQDPLYNYDFVSRDDQESHELYEFPSHANVSTMFLAREDSLVPDCNQCARSRGASRSNITPSETRMPSSSYFAIPSQQQVSDDQDTSLLENSSSASVFEGDNEGGNLGVSNTSTTSLEDLDTATVDLMKNNKNIFTRRN